jgi:hypothetical protein
MTTDFCRFRDFAVPLLGLSTRHPSIHEMHATQLVDSSSRTPHLQTPPEGLLLRTDDFKVWKSAGALTFSNPRPSVPIPRRSLCNWTVSACLRMTKTNPAGMFNFAAILKPETRCNLKVLWHLPCQSSTSIIQTPGRWTTE